ncbi:MAG: hypothetical protein ACFFD2_21820 [Promethearchaeota archaeon]
MLSPIVTEQYFPEISSLNEIRKYPFGIWVPLAFVNSGGLIEYLTSAGVYQDYFIKNSKLGPLLDIIRKNLEINIRQFSLLIGINSAHYSATIKNEKGIKFQKFLDLYIHYKENIPQISKFFEEILLSKKTSIYKTGSKLKLNFHPDGLFKIKFINNDYAILPTSKWETKKA